VLFLLRRTTRVAGYRADAIGNPACGAVHTKDPRRCAHEEKHNHEPRRGAQPPVEQPANSQTDGNCRKHLDADTQHRADPAHSGLQIRTGPVLVLAGDLAARLA
jgi:hypothetical protein